MKEKAKELTQAILNPLKELNNPIKGIIEEVLLKTLNEAYLKGYNDATNKALKTIKETFKK